MPTPTVAAGQAAEPASPHTSLERIFAMFREQSQPATAAPCVATSAGGVLAGSVPVQPVPPSVPLLGGGAVSGPPAPAAAPVAPEAALQLLTEQIRQVMQAGGDPTQLLQQPPPPPPHASMAVPVVPAVPVAAAAGVLAAPSTAASDTADLQRLIDSLNAHTKAAAATGAAASRVQPFVPPPSHQTANWAGADSHPGQGHSYRTHDGREYGDERRSGDGYQHGDAQYRPDSGDSSERKRPWNADGQDGPDADSRGWGGRDQNREQQQQDSYGGSGGASGGHRPWNNNRPWAANRNDSGEGTSKRPRCPVTS